MDNTEKGLGGIVFLLILALIWQWTTVNTLNQKVSACSWQLDTANISIGNANAEIANAKDRINGTFYEMRSALQNLGGDYAVRENPCSKNYSGDLSLLPKND